jgi:beta-glucosidase
MGSSKQPYRAVSAADSDKIPLRQYVDEASSDEDDLDSLTDGRDRKARKVGAARADGVPHAKQGSRRPWQQLCCGLQFSDTCLIIAFLLGAVTVIFLGGGGVWIYKTAPKDGQSPPWYPTPRGGTVGSWQQSYDKAREMVERMTLVEKVNITTGTG